VKEEDGKVKEVVKEKVVSGGETSVVESTYEDGQIGIYLKCTCII